MKNAIIAVVAVALIGAAFWGGTLYANAGAGAPGPGGFVAADGTLPAGGPMADLTDEERAELESMTAEERQAFFQERMGDAGAAGVPGGGMRGPGGGAIEGTVLELAEDTLTLELANGGSQTVYIDADTIVARADGAGDLAKGSEVLVIATPEADGVNNATAVVVK